MKDKDYMLELRQYYNTIFNTKSIRFTNSVGDGRSGDRSIDRMHCTNFRDHEPSITLYFSYPDNYNFLYTDLTYSDCSLEVFQTKSFDELIEFLESKGWVKDK